MHPITAEASIGDPVPGYPSRYPRRIQCTGASRLQEMFRSTPRGKMTLRVQPKWSEKIVKIVTDDLPEVPEAVMAPEVPSESSSSKRKSRRSNNSKFRLKGHGEPVSALVKTLEYVFALPHFCSEPCVTIHFHVEGDEGPILRWPILRSREGEEILAEGYCRIYLFPMIFSAQPIVGTVLTRPSPRAIRILKDMLIELAQRLP